MSFLSTFSKTLPGFTEQLVPYIFAIACAIGRKTGRWIGAEYRGVEAPQISCSECVDPGKDYICFSLLIGAES
jgi:hypothetical protein